jgi:hypothetical protein
MADGDDRDGCVFREAVFEESPIFTTLAACFATKTRKGKNTTINAELAEHAEQIFFCGLCDLCVQRRLVSWFRG